MKYFQSIIVMLMLFGCSVPVTTVRTVDSRPSVAVQGGPADADLFIDGIKVGKTASFNGKPNSDEQINVLLIETGTHNITVVKDGITIYKQDFFADSELKTFNIK